MTWICGPLRYSNMKTGSLPLTLILWGSWMILYSHVVSKAFSKSKRPALCTFDGPSTMTHSLSSRGRVRIFLNMCDPHKYPSCQRATWPTAYCLCAKASWRYRSGLIRWSIKLWCPLKPRWLLSSIPDFSRYQMKWVLHMTLKCSNAKGGHAPLSILWPDYSLDL